MPPPTGSTTKVNTTGTVRVAGDYRQFVRLRTASNAERALAATCTADMVVSLPPCFRMRPSTTTVSTFSGSAEPTSRCAVSMRHDRIDWRRLLSHMDLHWEVLLVHLLNYRWAYPSERQNLPRWLMDELLARLGQQLDLPPALVRT